MRQLSAAQILDIPTAERVRRDHHEAIRELQDSPLASARVIQGVELESGAETPVAHGLGRRPRIVLVSPPRDPSSTGRIEEIRSSDHDRTSVVALKASGWGATITVDLLVM